MSRGEGGGGRSGGGGGSEQRHARGEKKKREGGEGRMVRGHARPSLTHSWEGVAN